MPAVTILKLRFSLGGVENGAEAGKGPADDNTTNRQTEIHSKIKRMAPHEMLSLRYCLHTDYREVKQPIRALFAGKPMAQRSRLFAAEI